MGMVHISADLSGDWRPSQEHDGHEHAKSGEQHINVGSLSTLKRAFESLKNAKEPLSKLDFHTHGRKGALGIGKDHLDVSSLKQFEGHEFDTIFSKDAKIFFHGCNVAEGATGERFLAEFGVVFLKKGGGRVGASSTAGLRDPLFSGKSFHAPNSTVYANVLADGSVKLQNHSHLKPEHMQEHIQFIEKQVFPEFKNESVLEGKKHLTKAKQLLKHGDLPTIASIRTLCQAHRHIVLATKTALRLYRASHKTTQLLLGYRMWVVHEKLEHLQ